MSKKKKPAPVVDPETGGDTPPTGIIVLKPLGVVVETFPSAWKMVFRSQVGDALVTLAVSSALNSKPTEFTIWTGDAMESNDERLMAVIVRDHPNVNVAWNKAFGMACEFSIAALMFPVDMGRPN